MRKGRKRMETSAKSVLETDKYRLRFLSREWKGPVVLYITSDSFGEDCGKLMREVTKVEDSRSTNSTTLVDVDLLDERGSDGEDSLYAYAVRNLTDSKGFS